MTSSPEGRQEAAVLDAKALEAAYEVHSKLIGDALDKGDRLLIRSDIEAYFSALPAKPAVPDVAAKIIARTMCVMECENPDDRCPGKDGTIAARWEHRLTWAKTALDAALHHIIPAKPAVEVVEALKFYADPKNWTAGCWPEDPETIVDDMICMDRQIEEGGVIPFADCGERARKALAALQAPATPDAQTEVEK